MIKRISFLFVIACLFVGCAPVYMPSAHNVPMFSGKNEFQSSVSIGTGFNAQAAYAISDHIGLSTNYLYHRQKESQRGKKHKIAEFAIGYYNNLNEQWCVEVFGGYGFGKGSAYDSVYTFPFSFGSDQYEARGEYDKFFIQPSIGLNKGNFTFYFSGKLSYVDFNKIHLERGNTEVEVKHRALSYFSFAQGMRVSVLEDKLFLQYQGGFNIPIDRDPEYDFNFIMGSIGISFIPNRAKRQ